MLSTSNQIIELYSFEIMLDDNVLNVTSCRMNGSRTLTQICLKRFIFLFNEKIIEKRYVINRIFNCISLI